ncbi:MAG: hypothetical protein ACQKBY_02300, partial [Verrucomicrobiales bacterium]
LPQLLLHFAVNGMQLLDRFLIATHMKTGYTPPPRTLAFFLGLFSLFFLKAKISPDFTLPARKI